MIAKLRTVVIWLVTLLLAMLMGILVTRASADGPWLWQEKCPIQHYELRIEEVQRGVRLVSCWRMAEEVER